MTTPVIMLMFCTVPDSVVVEWCAELQNIAEITVRSKGTAQYIYDVMNKKTVPRKKIPSIFITVTDSWPNISAYKRAT